MSYSVESTIIITQALGCTHMPGCIRYAQPVNNLRASIIVGKTIVGVVDDNRWPVVVVGHNDQQVCTE